MSRTSPQEHLQPGEVSRRGPLKTTGGYGSTSGGYDQLGFGTLM